MPKLSAGLTGFETGDVVVTYYPEDRASRRLLHLTMILRGRDSVQDGFAHSDNQADAVRISPFDAYKELGGFLHARCNEKERAKSAAAAAALWATTAKATPYGSFPKKADTVAEDPKLAANRFVGMKDTGALTEIPFEPAALLRALKWTQRLKDGEPLSKLKGVTCAAFVVACHQAAALHGYLLTQGVISKLTKGFVKQIEGAAFNAKPSRDALEKLELTEDAAKRSGKTHVYKRSAMRDNSNRTLKAAVSGKFAAARTTLDTKKDEYPGIVSNKHPASGLADVELVWLQVQHKLGISTYAMERLADILPSEFMFDAKYVNSRLLTQVLRGSSNWAHTPYESY